MADDDPTRRAPGAWPRDRPIRWRGVATNLTWFAVSTASLVAQLASAIWLLVLDLPVRPLLAIAWGFGTVATAWAWVVGRWWVVVPPIVTIVGLGVIASLAGR